MSGRDMYQSEYPEEFYLWKQKVFENFIPTLKLKRDVLTNLVCIGDSDIEMEAAKKFVKGFEKIALKKVKFMSHPSLSNLIKSLAIIETKVKEIVDNPKTMKVGLIVEKKTKEQ